MMRDGTHLLAVCVSAFALAMVVVTAGIHTFTPPATGQLAACPDADAQADQVTEARLEASIFCLVNEQRRAAGLKLVRPNKRLRTAALGHTDHMVHQGFFSHDCIDGTDFVDRIRASGYLRKSRSWLVGENLAWGSAELSTPRALVRAWMESPPHRANLLRKRFRDLGVAAHRGTPHDAADARGVTVSSEYGCRKPQRRRA